VNILLTVQFVVDGNWTTNSSHQTETDASGNTNNVLTPAELQQSGPAHTLSSVAPTSTTAALAGAVPKEEEKKEEKDVPGTFPETPFETPAQEPQQFSVNPIPASSGAGNPVHLEPGEKVPAAGDVTSNTVASTVQSDSYDKPDELPGDKKVEANGTGLFGVPPVTNNMIPESSLPMGGEAPKDIDAGPTIQSAAPESTTAALAGAVPKEPRGVPEVVTESQKEAHVDPEAAASPEAVSEKKEVEQELLKAVPAAPAAAESASASAGATEAGSANAVPEEVKESISKAHVDPEATTNPEAVAEKAAVEAELKKEVPKTDEMGEPAPTVTAATSDGLSPTALADKEPLKSSSEAVNKTEPSTTLSVPPTEDKPADSRDVSPHSKPADAAAAAPAGPSEPTVTTGVDTATTEKKTEAAQPAATTPKGKTATADTPATPSTTDSTGKKKKRMSGFWGKIKEKLK
jgi:hypothetical protein